MARRNTQFSLRRVGHKRDGIRDGWFIIFPLYFLLISFIKVQNKQFSLYFIHFVVCDIHLDNKQTTGLFKGMLFSIYGDFRDFYYTNECDHVQVKQFRMSKIYHCPFQAAMCTHL